MVLDIRRVSTPTHQAMGRERQAPSRSLDRDGRKSGREDGPR